MVRVLSYNIRLGGTGHIEQLSKVMQSVNPDVVGLVEATDANVVKDLASRLGMQFRLTGEGMRERDWQVAVLSRLPIIQSNIHTRPAILTRQHLLEVQVEGTDGHPLTIFVIHLTAQIYRGSRSNLIRRTEVRELLNIMEASAGKPHLVMGDFNSLAPGDSFQASTLIRYYLDMIEQKVAKRSRYSFRRRALLATAHAIAHSKGGGFLIDTVGPSYARGGIDLLLKAGYVDCFRQQHQHEQGYTFPAATPATRIDYIFASPELAAKLAACEVITGVEGVSGDDASDHLPVWADFGAVG
jgi:endonuclease/exonuclease/phosphatase family metal-dependent hydrolase